MLRHKTFRSLLAIAFLCLALTPAKAQEEKPAAREHIGFQMSGSLARIVPQHDYINSLLHSYACNYQDVRLLWHTLPADGNAYDRSYHYPTLQAGIFHGDFSDIRLQRFAPEYTSRLGHAIALFGGMQIDFLRRGRWSLGCDLHNGVAFFTKHYDYATNRDNEVIGSVATIYVGASLQTRFRVAPQWSVGLSADFRHCSNGHITRPNLGTNTLSGSLSLAYDLTPAAAELPTTTARQAAATHISDSTAAAAQTPHYAATAANNKLRPKVFVDLTAGVSLKSLLEEFMVDPSGHVKTYPVFTAAVAPMVRYHRMHASGLQFDFMYAQYIPRVRELDAIRGHEGEYRYSPFIMGLALKHEIYYRHFSAHAGAGIYLRHRTGHYTATEESRLYQVLGLRYNIPATDDRLYVGYNVKAHHLSKADCMQFMIGYRL